MKYYEFSKALLLLNVVFLHLFLVKFLIILLFLLWLYCDSLTRLDDAQYTFCCSLRENTQSFA